MKKQFHYKWLVAKILLIVIVGMTISCNFTMRDANLYTEIIDDLKSNPKLSQKQIETCAYRVENGYVTIMVGGSGLSKNALNQIGNGKNMRDVWMFTDNRVDVLIEIEENLKKKSGVNGVTWIVPTSGTADVSISSIQDCQNKNQQETSFLRIIKFFIVAVIGIVIIAVIGGIAIFYFVYRKRKQNA